MAASAEACFMMPPRKCSPLADSPKGIAASAKALVLPSMSQTEICAWQPFPVRSLKGLGMKVARSPCFSATDLTMNLKNEWLVGRRQRVVILPVHLELAVRVFMVVLVGLPAELQHVVADLGDDVVAAHDRLLVVARLFGGVVFVGNLRPVRGDEKEFRLDARLDP